MKNEVDEETLKVPSAITISPGEHVWVMLIGPKGWRPSKRIIGADVKGVGWHLQDRKAHWNKIDREMLKEKQIVRSESPPDCIS
jgi:hypothetical protein